MFLFEKLIINMKNKFNLFYGSFLTKAVNNERIN